ncbi:HEAT repeat domain-containing protein [Paenibacillus filicis]|uniref:HEAT repeat domain-containing protein n=1 Tax=Paenibacillus gyeongsangnamensis TaxID=3388067 RepID=A0ABT4QAV7_9BACL|nr:HEAT repeat domain-containing protein [Paenibacillus filicis]MCZ8513820.1 HEAT repeat domain-containing protein [Paenibacillus filicis]
MWTEPLDQAASVLIVLGIAIVGGFAALFLLRARHGAIAERMKLNLEKHQDYFNYLSASIGSSEALLPPPGKLSLPELRAIQSKLLEWIETIGGEHREKLTALCRDLGLVELERQRLRSPWPGIRMEAVYHLGVMRAPECTDELLKLLEGREGMESTAFVIGRAAAKCASSLEELRTLLLLLTERHPQAHQLIADMLASSALDPAPLYTELLNREDDEALLTVALIGLSGRNKRAAFHTLDRLVLSEHREVRIKAAKILLQYTRLLPLERIGELIRHPDWEIRAAAVKAVGEQQLEFYLDALVGGLEDEQWWVRFYSAKSLSRLGPAGFEALCAAAAAAEQEESREAAWEAVHEELDRAAADSSKEVQLIPYYNRLAYIYRRKLGETRRGLQAEPARISS